MSLALALELFKREELDFLTAARVDIGRICSRGTSRAPSSPTDRR